MLRPGERLDGWHGVALVAITYVYFLIFAQFAFLARLGECGVAESALKTVMAAMAAGGVLFSLLTPALVVRFAAARLLRVGLLVCAMAAGLSLAPLNYPAAIAVAFLAGAGLGLLTITVVSHLPCWAGRRNPILMAGLGAGIAYFVCNVPAVFTAAPSSQALFAAVLCIAGLLLPLTGVELEDITVSASPLSFPLALLSFTALVWLDSAAFYIIQHTAVLKAGTWMGDLHLWANACIHLAAAILAALLLGSRRVTLVLAAAVLALGFACILLHRPDLSLSASLFYPAGVSFYSVALVVYPAFLSSSASLRDRARRAGWIYALAGWVASALGIGMGQHLGHVPLLFAAITVAIVIVPALLIVLRTRAREAAMVALTALLSFAVWRMLPASPIAAAESAAERGRQVYISEGCISCHSQYVRPGTAEQLMWGPVVSLEQVHRKSPPLIGNRRQGPDLAQIGSRRESSPKCSVESHSSG